MDAPLLTAAAARADITPPVGIQMVGFAARGPNTGQHDPLTATALVLASADTRVAIIACDLVYVGAEFVDAVAAEVQRRCGIPAENVMLCCSHTHYGPALPPGSDPGTQDMIRAYWGNLLYLLAGIVAEAASRTVPVRIGIGSGGCSVNINRREKRPDGTIILGRNHGGFTDREVLVVRLEEENGKPVAAVVNYPCHGVCLSAKWTLFSADFPGAMRDALEPEVGCLSLFLQGATGNMNPDAMGHDYENARKTGRTLADEAADVWDSIRPGTATGLAAVAVRHDLPAIRYLSLDNALRLRNLYQAELEQLRARGAYPAHRRWIERLAERADAAVKAWETGVPPTPVANRVHAVRFGPAALATSGGEVFAEIGTEVKKRSPFPTTLFAAYTNGDLGYIPVPEAYREGGYEVERACRVDPEAAEQLVSTCLQALSRVRP